MSEVKVNDFSERLASLYKTLKESKFVTDHGFEAKAAEEFEDLLNAAWPSTDEERAQYKLFKALHDANYIGLNKLVIHSDGLYPLFLWTDGKNIAYQFNLIRKAMITLNVEKQRYEVRVKTWGDRDNQDYNANNNNNGEFQMQRHQRKQAKYDKQNQKQFNKSHRPFKKYQNKPDKYGDNAKKYVKKSYSNAVQQTPVRADVLDEN